jgi:integrase
MLDASRATKLLADTPGAPSGVLEAVTRYCTALQTLAPFGADLAEVVNQFAAAELARRNSCTLGEAITRYLAHLQARSDAHEYSAFYVRDLPSKLNRARDYFGEDKNLADLTPAEVVEWMEALRRGKSAVSPATVSNLRRALSGLLSYACTAGLIADNPIRRMPRQKSTRKAKARKEVGILTPDQAAALLASARPRILPFLAIGTFCGIRPEEIRRMSWSDVDFNHARITVRAEVSKTGDKRHVTMPENLLAWLAPWRSAKGKIAPEKNERRLKDQAAAAARIEWIPDLLRHSAATYHLAKHRNASLTAEEMGHSVAVLHRHYNGRVEPALAAKWYSILPADEGKIIRTPFKRKAKAPAKTKARAARKKA